MALQTPKLIYSPGRVGERTFELALPALVVGRTSECEICIPHKSLSRRHARIDTLDGRLLLTDLESKNGSFVNGNRIERCELRPGDSVKLGDAVFVVAEATPPEPRLRPAAPAPPVITMAPAPPGPMPTLVVGLTKISFEHMLNETGNAGALRVKPADPDHRAQDKLEILLKISQILSSPDQLDNLLSKILDLVFQVLDVDRGAILLVDPSTGKLEPRAVKSLKGSVAARSIYSQHIVDYVRANSLAALFADARIDPRLHAAESVMFDAIRASMCVPLKPKDELIGVLYVDNLTIVNRFSEEDLSFLAAFGNQAAIAIENATLFRQIEQEAVARAQLVMQQKLAALGALVAGIAHEIKNPLNFINNFAELSVVVASELRDTLGPLASQLDEGTADAVNDALDDLQQNVTKITEHGKRANEIINGMLLHARGGSGTRELTDVNALVAEAVSLACREVTTKDPSFLVEIRDGYEDGLAPAMLVPTDITRVFLNVANNACYAMREKRKRAGASYRPVLEVSTRTRGDRVEIRIGDNGPGIPIEIVDKIWNPFFSTKPPGEGTGLGLSLSHDIVVEGHQGDMRVETSEAGSAFVVTLPFRGQQVTQRTSPPGARA